MAFPRSSLGTRTGTSAPRVGLIKTQQSSIQKCQYQDHPKPDDTKESEKAQQNSQCRRARLREEQKPALIQTIGNAAADQRKQKKCQSLRQRDRAQGEGRSVGDLQDQQALSDDLHPGADRGNGQSDP